MSGRNLEIKLNEIIKSNKVLNDRSAEDLFEWFACQDQSEYSNSRSLILTLAHRQAQNGKISLRSLVALASVLHRSNLTAFKQLAQSTNHTTFEISKYIESLVAFKPTRSQSKLVDILHCFSASFPDVLCASATLLFRYLGSIYGKASKEDKIIIVDTLYNLLQKSLHDSNNATLISEAFNLILDRTPPPELSDRPLKNASMMSDFETITESSTLLIPLTNFDLQIVGQRLELLVLDIMDVDMPSTSSTAQPAPSAPDLPPRPQRDPRIDVVLDIFPDQSPEFIEKALSLPKYSNPEALIESLLEGTVHVPQDEPEPAPAPAPQTRDVDEADDLDFSKLRIGKAKNFGLKMDDEARNELKAAVMRRAEEAQIEEIEAELEDEDDYASRTAVRSGTGDSTPTVEADYSILEKAFQENPSVFDKSSTTRRGKERDNLRQLSGLDDSQIEGWYSQLMRNPRKVQSLSQDKDMVNNNLDVPVQEGRSKHARGRGGSRGGARGASTAGRGKAPTQGSGHSGNNRQRQNKEKQGNTQRKRGHDKKFAGQAG
ncbi:hypothetical protein E3P99_03667 [Wallemia hederae]|uniref:CUE domain-containing protein n=1 Tax=Wallemia hederae TaxID=1540922 RepID=A0A4T0FII0_9BASI|nr:hypothetical protein E3P99_03667 [Wallemia hederae]